MLGSWTTYTELAFANGQITEAELMVNDYK